MAYRVQAKSDSLIERFVASFEKLDHMVLDEAFDFEAWKLMEVPAGKTGCERWAPVKYDTDPRYLDALYAKLPARFPPLYERLVLSYRWEEVDIRSCTLLANPAGPRLDGLFLQISHDPVLWRQLSRSGYIPFGKGSGGDYDPVCFDLKSRKKSADCKIVRINHEAILCNNRIKVVAEVAASFEALALQVIALAEKT
jgi:hypothetical protein